MKKWIVLFLLLFASGVNAQNYYAQGANSSNVNDLNQWNTIPAGGGSVLTWPPANGDVLYANGKTGLKVNVSFGSVGVVATLSTEAGPAPGTAGDGFALTTADNLTIYANFTAGTTTCLTITGSTGGFTLFGNLTGGGTAAAMAVTDSHTVATATINGNVLGGTGDVYAYGYRSTGAGPTVINGNCTSSIGSGCVSSGPGNITINGDSIGGAAASLTSAGSYASSTGIITITGNIINSVAGVGAIGKIKWLPSSAQKYIMFNGGTPIYASAGLGSDAGGATITGANTSAQVKPGAYFIKKDDGVYTQGTATLTGVGGGSWSF